MEKNNKLIAEFMGISIDGDFGYLEDEGSPLEEVIPIDSLQYDSSWDWLMPVIHKCFDVAKDGQMSDIMHHLQVAEMGDTYDAVVEFIKDYNQNK